MGRSLQILVERFPIPGTFVIARGAKTEAAVVVVTIEEGAHRGRGESVPYIRYGESVDTVVAAIEAIRGDIVAGVNRAALLSLLPPGAARNAVDCALWDLAAKESGRPVWESAGLAQPSPVTTAFTLSVGAPEAMAEAARRAAHRPLLKVKLAGEGDPERIAAVRAAAPEADLIVDANEAWREADLDRHFAACLAARVGLIEQPLPAGADGALAQRPRPVPVCADESAHVAGDLAALVDRYDAVNIKLDKAGGLTAALAMEIEARRLGLLTMVGCMVGTSLAMAPATLLAAGARFVDLDGPLLLAKDRAPGLRYEGSIVWPPASSLWG